MRFDARGRHISSNDKFQILPSQILRVKMKTSRGGSSITVVHERHGGCFALP